MNMWWVIAKLMIFSPLVYAWGAFVGGVGEPHNWCFELKSPPINILVVVCLALLISCDRSW